MEIYKFKLNGVEEEFTPVEISEDMKNFLDAYRDTTMSGETEEYEVHHIDSIHDALRDDVNFETGASDGVMGEYGREIGRASCRERV